MRFPDNQQRISIIGKTGSGKTHAGLWHLSIRDFKIPWVVINTKDEKLFYDIPHAEFIDYKDKIPQKGLFILTPFPGEEEILDIYFIKLWARGEVGIMIDEAADIGKLKGYQRIIRQGRSKYIPVIQLMQRPAGVNRLVISESEFFQIFFIKDKRDKETIENFIPDYDKNLSNLGMTKESYYYDVASDEVFKLQPLPALDIIYERLNEKLKHKYKLI